MMEKNIPLATLLRPTKLADIVGQDHLLGNNGLLTKIIEKNKATNLIFYGYPGIGKTSLAIVLAKQLQLPFAIFQASLDKKEQLEKIVQLAKISQQDYVIIIDEIHRLNKDKQDILLPLIEDGTIIVFGVTTENPFFALNPAIRSRCQLIPLVPIETNQLAQWLKNKIQQHQLAIDISEQNLLFLAQFSNGDVRFALNLLQIINDYYPHQTIDQVLLTKICQCPMALVSSYGNEYYDLLSAFHKSIRGSDVDASLYYLARLLLSQDLDSITRRMIACVYEDIGLANPGLCQRVVTCAQAVKQVGLPEAQQILATTVIEMCLSPKSNSAIMALQRAQQDVLSGKNADVPIHLKDAHYANASKLGVQGYLYPHDYPNSWVNQQYLPNQLKNQHYYYPKSNPWENQINETHQQITSQKKQKNFN